MIISRHQNVIQNQNTVIGNSLFENVEKFRYLGVTVTNTNDIREEIKRRIKCLGSYLGLRETKSWRLYRSC